MSAPSEFQIAMVAGKPASVNGTVKALVVPTVRGEQMPPESVRLDSRKLIAKTAKDWCERFGIDEKIIQSKLDQLATLAVAKHVERKQRFEQARKDAETVSAVADRFLATLKPEWHRAGKSIYLAKVKREVTIGGLWSLLDDVWLGIIAKTREAVESDSTTYRATIGLFRDALAIAAAKAIAGLPEHVDVEQDATLVAEELRREVVAWLIKPRTFRQDNGNTVGTSYHAWASAIAPESPWQQCYCDPVFAGFVDEELTIAVKGEWLTQELKRPSGKKLAADLRLAGLADTDGVTRVTGKCWRVWILSQTVFRSIAELEVKS